MKTKNTVLLTAASFGILAAGTYGAVRYIAAGGREQDLSMLPPHPGNGVTYRARILREKSTLERQPWETVSVISQDGLKLVGSFLPLEDPKGTVILFHGYRSKATNDFSLSAMGLYRRGYQLLLVDQRAHGRSEGDYITFGSRERGDVVTWCNYAANRFGTALPVYLVGLSMGATSVLLATGLTLPDNVRGAVADCGFTSGGEIIRRVMRQKKLPADVLYPLLRPAFRLFAGFDPDEASTLDAMKHCKIPVLFVHGTEDRFVPHSMTAKAYLACRGEKELFLVGGASHGYSYAVDTTGYEAALDRFFRVCQKKTSRGEPSAAAAGGSVNK